MVAKNLYDDNLNVITPTMWEASGLTRRGMFSRLRRGHVMPQAVLPKAEFDEYSKAKRRSESGSRLVEAYANSNKLCDYRVFCDRIRMLTSREHVSFEAAALKADAPKMTPAEVKESARQYMLVGRHKRKPDLRGETDEYRSGKTWIHPGATAFCALPVFTTTEETKR